MITRRLLGLGAAAVAVLSNAGQALAETFNVQFYGQRKGWFKGRSKVSVAAYQVNFITLQQATAVGGFGRTIRRARCARRR